MRRGVWLGAGVALALVVFGVYRGAIGYGLIWDDPHWFRQGAGLSLGELLRGTERYQFYRPLSLLYFRQWWQADGSLDIRGLHAAEVLYHLLATWLTLALARAWGAARPVAALAAVTFALFPFSQQAVAWAAPQQPLVTVLLLGAAVAVHQCGAARQSGDTGAGRSARTWSLVAILSYTAALLVQETAAAFAPLLTILAWRVGTRGWRLVLALAFSLLALGYGAQWWSAPRLGGVAGAGLDGWVAGFLLQAVAFPVTRVLSIVAAEWSSLLVTVAGGTTWLGVTLVLSRRGHRRLALLASTWALLALLPAWIGLGRDYVAVGQRLVYVAVPGIAMLWAGLVGLGLCDRRGWVRALTFGLTVVVLGTAARDVMIQNRMLAAGADHLAQAIQVTARARSHSGFVNFPDRYFLRRAPYPLGDWGVTLAPVVMDLSDFARAATGAAGGDESWSVPRIGTGDRSAWPYTVDMRGDIVDAAGLREIAERADGIYLSDYLPDGTLRLRPVGGLGPHAAPEPAGGIPRPFEPRAEPVATFGDVAVLRTAWLEVIRPDLVRLRLTWQVRGRFQPDDTVFVHVFGADGRQVLGEDGDGWGGLLPLVDWPRDRLLSDVRTLDIRALPAGTYRVTVGLYHRPTNARYRAVAAGGRRFVDDEVDVGTIHVR